MKRGLSYSKTLAALCAASAVAAFAMGSLRHEVSLAVARNRSTAAAREGGLSAQIAAKSPYENEDLEALRLRAQALRGSLGDDSTWEKLTTRAAGRWRVEAGADDRKNGYKQRVATMTLLSASVADWPEVVKAVGDLESIPGIGIAEFEMKTSGGREQRTLDVARVLVSVRTRQVTVNPPTSP